MSGRPAHAEAMSRPRHRSCSWLHGTLPCGASRPMEAVAEQLAVPAPPEQLVLRTRARNCRDSRLLPREANGRASSETTVLVPNVYDRAHRARLQLPNRNGVCRAARP